MLKKERWVVDRIDGSHHQFVHQTRSGTVTVPKGGLVMHYPAVVAREGRVLLAEFPDCPGCQTFAEDQESLEANAEEALTGWLESNLGRDLVPPRPGQRSGKNILLVPVPVSLGLRMELRWARDEAKLTQAQLAKRIGMTQQQLANLESENANPTFGTITRVAKGLGRNVIISLVPAGYSALPLLKQGRYQQRESLSKSVREVPRTEVRATGKRIPSRASARRKRG